jgi:hypothetical protein
LPNPYIMGNGSYKGTSSDNQLHWNCRLPPEP